MNEFTIHAQLPSLNEYVKANRSHWSKGDKFRKNIESIILWEIKLARSKKTLRPIEKPCEILIEWHERTKRRDVDNIQSSQKFILDSLQYGGILKNDSRNHVKQIRHEIVDDKEDFVVVKFIEV